MWPTIRHNWRPRAMLRSGPHSPMVGRLPAFKTACPALLRPHLTRWLVGSRTHVTRNGTWNFSNALGQKTSLTLNYVGNHGVHEVVQNPGLNAFCDQSLSELHSTTGIRLR